MESQPNYNIEKKALDAGLSQKQFSEKDLEKLHGKVKEMDDKYKKMLMNIPDSNKRKLLYSDFKKTVLDPYTKKIDLLKRHYQEEQKKIQSKFSGLFKQFERKSPILGMQKGADIFKYALDNWISPGDKKIIQKYADLTLKKENFDKQIIEVQKQVKDISMGSPSWEKSRQKIVALMTLQEAVVEDVQQLIQGDFMRIIIEIDARWYNEIRDRRDLQKPFMKKPGFLQSPITGEMFELSKMITKDDYYNAQAAWWKNPTKRQELLQVTSALIGACVAAVVVKNPFTVAGLVSDGVVYGMSNLAIKGTGELVAEYAMGDSITQSGEKAVNMLYAEVFNKTSILEYIWNSGMMLSAAKIYGIRVENKIVNFYNGSLGEIQLREACTLLSKEVGLSEKLKQEFILLKDATLPIKTLRRDFLYLLESTRVELKMQKLTQLAEIEPYLKTFMQKNSKMNWYLSFMTEYVTVIGASLTAYDGKRVAENTMKSAQDKDFKPTLESIDKYITVAGSATAIITGLRLGNKFSVALKMPNMMKKMPTSARKILEFNFREAKLKFYNGIQRKSVKMVDDAVVYMEKSFQNLFHNLA